MQPLIVAVILALLGGIAVGLQGPLASLISQRVSAMGSAFVIHVSGAVIAGAVLLLTGGAKLSMWRGLPWYALGTGLFGVVVIGAVSYTIPRIGVASTVTLLVTAQLILSALLDHFGLLGTELHPLDLSRLAGIVVLLGGTWLIVR
jgi:transporter family-2 protein